MQYLTALFPALFLVAGYPSHDRAQAQATTTAPTVAVTAEAHDHATETAITAAVPAWRYVQHYGCGWVGYYCVDVPNWNTIRCCGCGCWFNAYVW